MYIVWALSVIASFWLGYHIQRLTKKVEILEDVVKAKVDRKPEPVEPRSTLIDLTDPVKEAQYAREQLMKKMNDE